MHVQLLLVSTLLLRFAAGMVSSHAVCSELTQKFYVGSLCQRVIRRHRLGFFRSAVTSRL